MGDDSEDPSRVERTEGSTSYTNGGAAAFPNGVIPVFESPPARKGLAKNILPRFESEQSVLDGEIIPTIEPHLGEDEDSGDSDESTRFGKSLPVFEDPQPGSIPAPFSPIGQEVDEILPEEKEEYLGIKGPEYDEEMPLADHIEEMIKRLAVVIVVAGSVSLVTWPFTPQIIDFLWYSMLPAGDIAQPRVYGPLEFLLTRIKVASLAGLVVALPILVYETYAFMRPGLYPHERKYYLAAIPTSLVLAVVGVLFAYLIVLPALFTYFLSYSESAGEIAFALARTFDLILIMMAYLALVFQIPLLIMMAIMIGVTTRRWLAEKRLYFWGAFLGLAFISSPDPTGMAPILIALTMIALFEGTIGILKWVGR